MANVVIGCLIITVVTLGILLNSALKREALLSRTIEGYDEYFKQLQTGLEFVISEIKAVDLRGSFESDDEVGVVFKAIANMIASLKVFINEE